MFTEVTNVVQPVGFNYPSQRSYPSTLPIFQTGHLVQSLNGPVCMATMVPTIHLPGWGPQVPPINTSAAGLGYTSNHLVYHKT